MTCTTCWCWVIPEHGWQNPAEPKRLLLISESWLKAQNLVIHGYVTNKWTYYHMVDALLRTLPLSNKCLVVSVKASEESRLSSCAQKNLLATSRRLVITRWSLKSELSQDVSIYSFSKTLYHTSDSRYPIAIFCPEGPISTRLGKSLRKNWSTHAATYLQ